MDSSMVAAPEQAMNAIINSILVVFVELLVRKSHQ
jgi:hypothetical protein